jgi:glycosyltransferase involved in cell wall biosynthesis
VVVIPSRILSDGRTEGTPVVCLEAMAAGRVVIASRVGGLAEVIIDNENGLLFDPEDYYELRQKILTILEDKHLRRKIEEEAIRRSANYSWQLTGSRYAELIKKALRYDGVIGNRRIEVSSIN